MAFRPVADQVEGGVRDTQGRSAPLWVPSQIDRRDERRHRSMRTIWRRPITNDRDLVRPVGENLRVPRFESARLDIRSSPRFDRHLDSIVTSISFLRMNGGVQGSLYWSTIGSSSGSIPRSASTSRCRRRSRVTRSSVACHENRRVAVVRTGATTSRTVGSVGVGARWRVLRRQVKRHGHRPSSIGRPTGSGRGTGFGTASRANGRGHRGSLTGDRHWGRHRHVFRLFVRPREVSEQPAEGGSRI